MTVVIHISDVMIVSQRYGCVYNAIFVTMHKGEGFAENQQSYRCQELYISYYAVNRCADTLNMTYLSSHAKPVDGLTHRS